MLRMNTSSASSRVGGRGQSLVETAIVTPLFIFMILGVLQMGMVYHAAYLVKYAAYRAARTGSLLHAKHDAMYESAFAVLVPVLSTGLSVSSENSNSEPSKSSKFNPDVLYFARYNAIKGANTIIGAIADDLLRIVICGPTKKHLQEETGYKINNLELDFDDAANYIWTKDDYWKSIHSFERTKLRIQVQLFFHLKIPLANFIIYQIYQGKQIMTEMRMGKTNPWPLTSNHGPGASTLNKYAVGHTYLLPLHDNYPFRMQSTLYPDKEGYKLPDNNQCWHYKDGSDGEL